MASEPVLLKDHLTGLYFVAPTPEGPTKIGVTRNLQIRLTGLQTGAWLPLKVYGFRLCMFMSMADRVTGRRYQKLGGRRADLELAAYHIEQTTHAKLREMGFGLVGEWFDLTPAEAIAAAAKCAELREARLVGIEDLGMADMRVAADPSVLRAHTALTKELAQINNYIRIFNATKHAHLDGTK